MSGFLAVNTVSGVLQRVIATACGDDPVTSPLVSLPADISLDNPKETAGQSAFRVSLWLYQIVENEYLKNAPAPHGPERQGGRVPPLALDLAYLLTPFTGTAVTDQVVLGKIMQILHENASLYIRDTLNGVVDEIRVVLCRLPLQEITNVWQALSEPYRLSVCYLVRVVRIDGELLEESVPVIEVTTGLAPAVPPGAVRSAGADSAEGVVVR